MLKQEDKDKLVSYINSVSKTNEEFKQIQTLSVTLSNVDEELKENREKIKLLTENNEALTLRVETLTKNVKTKDKEIDKLKEENYSLKSSLEHLINKFTNLIKLIKNKIFSKKETREKYIEFSRDLYTHGIIDDKEITDIKEDYDYCKNRDNGKYKDDYEIEM